MQCFDSIASERKEDRSTTPVRRHGLAPALLVFATAVLLLLSGCSCNGGADPVECLQDGVSCESAGDCCSDFCVDGVCSPDGEACVAYGEPCEESAECCGALV